MRPNPGSKAMWVVIPLLFVEMSSDESELTFFCFFDEILVFVMVERLEQYNLLLSVNSHMKLARFSHTRHIYHLEQERWLV